MINLIPNQEKKKMARDFYIKLVAVFYLVLGSAVFIASTSILPPYFLSSVNKNAVNDRLKLQSNVPVPVVGEDTLNKVKEIDKKLILLEGLQGKQFLVSEKVINKIISLKSPEIRISRISYRSLGENGRTIILDGIANNRKSLLSFNQALKDDASFKEVNLPISNFVKESDIIFSISLIPKEL